MSELGGQMKGKEDLQMGKYSPWSTWHIFYVSDEPKIKTYTITKDTHLDFTHESTIDAHFSNQGNGRNGGVDHYIPRIIK
jgi:hypothetical protein